MIFPGYTPFIPTSIPPFLVPPPGLSVDDTVFGGLETYGLLCVLFTFEMALQFSVSDEGMFADVTPKLICVLVFLNILLKSFFADLGLFFSP
jgi:hypothetical protein